MCQTPKLLRMQLELARMNQLFDKSSRPFAVTWITPFAKALAVVQYCEELYEAGRKSQLVSNPPPIFQNSRPMEYAMGSRMSKRKGGNDVS